MKKLLLSLTLLIFSATVFAQIETPVKWSYAAKKTGKNQAVVMLKATIDEGWHVYSQNIKEGGPEKTSFMFTPSKNYTLVGTTVEPKGITKFEQVFGMDVVYFEKSVIFQQKVKLNAASTTVKGTLRYMTCNDQKCKQPEEVEFSIPVK